MITQEYTSPVSLLSDDEFAAFATAVRQIAALELTTGRRSTFRERVDRYAYAVRHVGQIDRAREKSTRTP